MTLTRFRILALAAAMFALPYVTHAQTANTPGGQAGTATPLDQTTGSSQKSTPKTTKTNPDATNPTGSTSTSGSTMSPSTTDTHKGMKHSMSCKPASQPGDPSSTPNTPKAGDMPK